MYNSDFGLKSKRSKVKPLKSCRVIANILVKGCVTCPKCYERLQINFPEEKQNKGNIAYIFASVLLTNLSLRAKSNKTNARI